MRVDAESAFVLHSRPYRESSQLVDLFSHNHGRIKVIARGARSRKSGQKLNLFTPLVVSWGGRSDLKTLYSVEADGPAAFLQGRQLYTGLYLNELLIRMLPEADLQRGIFQHYRILLEQLSCTDDLEPLLRLFEFGLLEELGYGLSFDFDAEDGEPVVAGNNYFFQPESGFSKHFDARTTDHRALFDGVHLVEIGRGNFSNPEIRSSAKRLSRLAFVPHLGGKPLRSRELFVHAQRKEHT